jgi:hypothetical protein
MKNALAMGRAGAASLADWMRRHRFLSSLILFFFVWRVFWWHFDTPIRNPWPQDTYIVKGRFPFDKGFDLIFMQQVHGDAYWHQLVCGWISLHQKPIPCGGKKSVYFKPKQIDGQHYEVTLYRDYFFSGLPGWRLDGINEWSLGFKAGTVIDPAKGNFQGVSQMPVVICSDSSEDLIRFKEQLFCAAQFSDPSRTRGYVKYMSLDFPLSAQPAPNVKVQDFWLESELQDAFGQKALNPKTGTLNFLIHSVRCLSAEICRYDRGNQLTPRKIPHHQRP